MASKARTNIDLTPDKDDDNENGGGQVDTVVDSPGRNWLTEELLARGVPEFGLEQWLLHFMREALKSEMSDSQLLNFFCLARDRGLSDEEDYVNLLMQVEAMLYSRMPDSFDGTPTEDDGNLPGYEPDRSLDAMKDVCAGHMPDRHLVEMFDLSATLRGEPDVGHMWEAVMYLSRAQILRRMENVRARKIADNCGHSPDAAPGPTTDRPGRDFVAQHDSAGGPTDANKFQEVSLRQALRIAEDAFRPDMTDEKLFDLYVLVKECGTTELNIFEELAEEVSALLFKRLKAGSPDPAFDRSEPSFDYPLEGVKALRAVMRGDQPHRNLLMYYRMTWDDMRNGDTWTAIADMSRAQILRRMRPQNLRGEFEFEEWELSELAHRVSRHR